jgi:protein phosphatase
MRLSAHGITDLGRHRENNEDSLLLAALAAPLPPSGRALPVSGSLSFVLTPPGVLLAVSDGMGGCNAGEVASALALATLHPLLAAAARTRPADAAGHLLAAIHATDARIQADAAAHPAHAGMGATLTALWLDGADGAWLGQVGDSRLYRLRGGMLAQLSPEHSPVGRLRREGLLTGEQARHHYYRGVIDQSLGGPPAQFAPEVLPVHLVPGDVVLLCTDGLTDSLDEAEIARVLTPLATGGKSEWAVCAALIAAANAASGRDNLTALVVRFDA